MEVFVYTVPSVMLAGALFAAYKVLSHSRGLSRTWRSGLMAEGRCLNAYTTTGGGGDSTVHTTLHHVYEFRTREGQVVRFEEGGGPATVVQGDIVTVRYPADRPEKATAKPPAQGSLAVGTGCALVFLGAFAAGCVAFMVGVHSFFAAADGLMP